MQLYYVLKYLMNEPYKLSNRELFLLISCGMGPQTVRGIAPAFGNKPSVTRASDKLIELGLIKRVADPHDRRSVNLIIMPEGMRLIKALDKIGNPMIKKARLEKTEN
jgi:DNA-binding MarR family transcriptional regulator